MNTYHSPAFTVLEIPSPVREAIQSLRESLFTLTSRLPVEITVTGSSGIGPIPTGTDKTATETSVKRVLSAFEPFTVRFQEIRCFSNTSIYYLAPHDRDPFDRLHEALKTSGIVFASSLWPYNPHCTLRSGPMTDRMSAIDILNLSFPKQDFVVDTLSIYELDALGFNLPPLISVEDVIGHSNQQSDMCPMNITSEDLWGAIHSIGSKDGTAGEIATDVLSRLIELKMVKVKKKSGKPKLTKCGKKCFLIMESGDSEIPELDIPGSKGGIEWPTAIRCNERLPEEGVLVVAWKPIIEGWDIVVGRDVINGPDQYTHWLPMMPRPE